MVLFFEGLQFTVDFTSKHFPYKRKQEIRRNITENGGTISYILNNKTKFFVSENHDVTETYKGRTASKLGIPIVSFSFIDKCTEQQKLLDGDDYLTVGKSTAKQFSSGIIKATVKKSSDLKEKPQKSLTTANLKATRVYLYNQDSDSTAPFFATNDYEIIKNAWFKKTDKNGLCFFVAIELHISTATQSPSDDRSRPTHRVFSHLGVISKGTAINGKHETRKECRYAHDSDTAEQLYSLLCAQQLFEYHRQFSVFPPGIGSSKMISNNISSQISNKDSLSPSVKSLVHGIWSDAIGELSSLLSVPVERLKLEDVDKAEGILQAIRETLDKSGQSQQTVKKFSDEFYSLIPHHEKSAKEINCKRVIAEKQDLCQLIKDMLSVSEATNFSTRSSDEAKYKAMGCYLENISKTSDEYMNVVNRVQSESLSNMKVHNVFTCERPVEASNFQSNIGNIQPLFHSSKAPNFLGILSRGLLLPKIVVSDFGGERSDAGNLGTGIYFGLDASTSVKYSSPGETRGSRILLVCDVALGSVKDYAEFGRDLESAPEGYQSCHGVKNRPDVNPTSFEEDEFVVYSVSQQKIRYLVEFSLPGDDVKINDAGDVITSSEGENILYEPTTALSLDEKADSSDEETDIENITTSDIVDLKDPLDKVKPGLRFEGDTLVPLQSVHIRAKLLDLCAKVVVMQVYNNSNSKPIEAKYVFPLDDMAAVCGFEAFINDKHIVGEVKEKEQAHKEYKKAISEGHGAYLMDEETPDVFTVSVGNIPPGATVLIKITYVAELPVEDENIVFNLPGSLAPWSRDLALKDSTQDVLESVNVDNENPCELSIHVAVEMPFDIRTLDCPSHDVKIKKTATKAVIQMKEDQVLATGFQLLIGLAEIHVPRMWAERLPENSDSQACMLSFYPEFEAEPMANIEYVFLLDISCSMKGSSLEDAKKILLLAVQKLPANSRFNILAFGSQWLELFPSSVEKSEKSLKEATAFIKRCTSDLGATDIWKVLKALNLLPIGTDVHVRNVCILSDGHVTEEELSLKLATSNPQQSRIFTFGVGSSANRYFLRTMAKVGAGASEYFDSKVKSKWQRKVESLLTKSQQPVLTSVSVAWQQFDNDAPTPIQAPNQILSLFNGSRQVVYGFVPYCTQATLKAKINGKEISTMVSTSELSMTSGSTLHQLTARALINDWEDGLLAPDQLHHQAVKVSRKDYIIEISKKYSVTSKFTSFVAIEKRDEGETFDSTSALNVDEILDGESVDILGYIGWLENSEDEAEIPIKSGLVMSDAISLDAGLFEESEEFEDYGSSVSTSSRLSPGSSSSSSDASIELYEERLGWRRKLARRKRSSAYSSSNSKERFFRACGFFGASGSSPSSSDASIELYEERLGCLRERMIAMETMCKSISVDAEKETDATIRTLTSEDVEEECSYVKPLVRRRSEMSLKKASRKLMESEEAASDDFNEEMYDDVTLNFSEDELGYEVEDIATRKEEEEFLSFGTLNRKKKGISMDQIVVKRGERQIRNTFSFGAPALQGSPPKHHATLFGETVKRAGGQRPGGFSFGAPAKQTSPPEQHTALFEDGSTLEGGEEGGFSFGAPAQQTSPPEQHTALFGGGSTLEGGEQAGGFSFGAPAQQTSPPEQPTALFGGGIARRKGRDSEEFSFGFQQQQQEEQQRQHPQQQKQQNVQSDGFSFGFQQQQKQQQQAIQLGGFSFGLQQQQQGQEQQEQQKEKEKKKREESPPRSRLSKHCISTGFGGYAWTYAAAPTAATQVVSHNAPPPLPPPRPPKKSAPPRPPKKPVSLGAAPSASSIIQRSNDSVSLPIPSLMQSTAYTPTSRVLHARSEPELVQKASSTIVSADLGNFVSHSPYRALRKKSPAYSPTIPPYSPTTPAYSPTFPAYSPTSPAYSPTFPGGAPPCPLPCPPPCPPPPPPPAVDEKSPAYCSASPRVPRNSSNNALPPSQPPKATTVLAKSVPVGKLLCGRKKAGCKTRSEREQKVYGSLRASALLEKSMDKSEAKMAKQIPEQEFHGLFELQSEEGWWTLPDSRLDEYIGIKTDAIEKLLIECGAKSLGTRIFGILCKMLATLLALAFLRRQKPSSFPLRLVPPFQMRESSEGSEIEWQAKVAKALTWLKTVDKLVPCVCTRLQLGNNWEDVIPKLLGYV